MCALVAIQISLLLSPLYSQCTEVIPGWSESYCPEEVDRVEYQIPMDEKQLEGNTVTEIDAFLQWMVDNLQDTTYLNYFRLRTEKIKKYHRTVAEIDITKSKIAGATGAFSPPRSSGIKYRRSFGNFQHGASQLKYQNDLTWENAMSTPGTDIDMTSVLPKAPYMDIFGTKLEANIQYDTCTPNYLSNSNIVYGETGTGFSAKIEFDDDDTYGTDDTNGQTMIDTSNWNTAADGDGSFVCDCATQNCICCDVETYFHNYCDFYDDNANVVEKEFNYLGDTIHYILDIDFYWHKNGNLSTDETSKGKFTFQTRYSDANDFQNDIPADGGTEISMKLYKSKTVDGEWHALRSFAEGLIDSFTGKNSGAATWIDHSMCTSNTECCTNLANTQQALINVCENKDTQNKCETPQTGNGENKCQWISCADVGDCEWSGNGGTKPQNKCGKITEKDVCESSFNGNCNWVLRTNDNMKQLLGEQIEIGRNVNNYGMRYVLGLFCVLIVLVVGYNMYTKCLSNGKGFKVLSSDSTPLLMGNSV